MTSARAPIASGSVPERRRGPVPSRASGGRLRAASVVAGSGPQLLVFCLVGAGGYVLNLCTFALAMALGGPQLLAAAAAFGVAVVSNFWCNRRWTFGAGDRRARCQAARFSVVSVAAFLLASALLELLVELGGVAPLGAQAAAIVATTPLSFLGNKLWSFRGSSPVTDAVATAGGAGGSSTWLVVPTYNEAENLEPFVRAVLPRLAVATSEYHVLIVDDSSPDGTGEIADRLAAELAPVHVLHRARKEGLGRAYAAGFERALAAGAQLVVQMDADFSHDPDSVPSLIAAARDADLVLGSRYVAGGGVADWGVGRRFLSRAGSWYARTVLGLPIRDLTGGFKCFRREVLERVGMSAFQTAGFGFQIEVTYRAVQAGARVCEVPIRFRHRRVGVSKMSASIVVEALYQVLVLRLRRAPREAVSPLEPALRASA